ncbi:hypothetical protein AY600_18575 [Phormidium willei BDU 130791]|nr:hypothetical protein AY600_18575 [Phormidium willei BDU 130791]
MAQTQVETETNSVNNGIAIAPKRLSPEQFKTRFEQLVPLIAQEWTHLDREELMATDGDLDLAVDVIATATDHTKTLIQAQLAELHSLSLTWERREHQETALQPTPSQSPSHSSNYSPNPDKDNPDEEHPPSPSIDDVLDLLERRTEQLVERVKADVLPEVKSQAKRNLGASILTALGIGFLLGLFVGGSGGDRK